MEWLRGLRGLFGSSARQNVTDGGAFVARADPNLDDPISRTMGVDVMRRPPVMDGAPEKRFLGGMVRYQRPEGQTGADRMTLAGATLSDIGAGLGGRQGGSLERVQSGFRKRVEEAQAQARAAQMQDLAQQLYGDDPEAQLLFMADPEAFVGARAERLKPRTMSGGQTYIDPMTGQRVTAPSVEKMDDRMVYYDPATGEARYSERRGATIAEEETGRSNRADEAVARGNLGVAQGNLGIRAREFEERKRQGGFGTPGSVGGWEEF